MTKGLIENGGEEVPRDQVAMGRWGNPEEVANVYVRAPEATLRSWS